MGWKAKLTSRKFWAAVASFVVLLVVAFGGTQVQAAQITAIIMAGATVIAYIVGEGLVDAAAVDTTQIVGTTLAAKTLGKVMPTNTGTAPVNTNNTGVVQAADMKQDTTSSSIKLNSI